MMHLMFLQILIVQLNHYCELLLQLNYQSSNR